MGTLENRVAVVTGATSGIGMETALELARRGASVILGVRNVESGARIAEAIKRECPSTVVEVGPPLDLGTQDSVRQFAKYLNDRSGPLNILVNNAGIGFVKKAFTDQGVGLLAQVNHLGPYTLTRLVEKKLIEGKGRVVMVASVTHRQVKIKDARGFLTDWRQQFYEYNKLANVMMAYELQRRLGPLGVQACAADPGAVATAIWSHSPKFSQGLYKKFVDSFYSPPADGAKVIIHAATVDWDKEKPKRKEGATPLLPHQDLRYYARGAFTWPIIVYGNGVRDGRGFLDKMRANMWETALILHTALDWPLRRMSKGKICGTIFPVKSSVPSYDEKMAASLWEVSAEFAQIPVQVAS